MINMQYLYHPLDKVFITQSFGAWPEHYRQYGLKAHNGTDYRVKFVDSPMGRRYVSAALDGKAIVRFDKRGYGTHVRLVHPDGSMTIYGHLTRPYIKDGQAVKAQQIIGLSGNTGDSTAAHLHFEYRPAPIRSKNGYAGAVDTKGLMLATLPKQFWG